MAAPHGGGLQIGPGSDGDLVALVKDFDAAWNAHDEAGVLRLVSDDVECYIPNPPPPLREVSRGRDEMREFVRVAIPDIFVESTDHQVRGNTVTWQFRLTGQFARSMGAEPLAGTAEAMIERGRIKRFALGLSTWEALRARDAEYRGVFEATSDGLIISDLGTGALVEANPAVCRMHGYTREEFLRLHPTQFIHSDYHHVYQEFLNLVRAGGEFVTRAVDVRKDGSSFYVDVRGAIFSYRGRPHILAVVRDVTEQVHSYELLERRVEARTRELTTLLEVSHDIASTLEPKPLIATILDRLKVVVNYTGASIATLEGEEFVVLDSRGPSGREDDVVGMRIATDRSGPVWEAIRRREPVIVDDIRGDDPMAVAFRQALGPRLEAPAFAYIRSWLLVPLMVKGQVCGILSCSRDKPGALGPRHARLALAFASQAAVAMENARLFAAAQDRAALEERQRLARDLHDSVSQTLFSASLIAEVLPHLWRRDPEEGHTHLEELRQLTRGALAEMRLLLLELRPAALAEVSLSDLLRQLAESTTGRGRLPVELTIARDKGCPLTPEVKLALYRMAQEALHNATKHAAASRAAVSVVCSPKGVSLHVRDDGRGFDVAAVPPERLGLTIMRERARAVGASLRISSAPGKGTEVKITWRAQCEPGHDATRNGVIGSDPMGHDAAGRAPGGAAGGALAGGKKGTTRRRPVAERGQGERIGGTT